MTHQQILEKAIRLAIDNGWDWKNNPWKIKTKDWFLTSPWTTEVFVNWLIFNKRFAKALWGEHERFNGFGENKLPNYQLHLQQMVKADDPIAYLGDNIK